MDMRSANRGRINRIRTGPDRLKAIAPLRVSCLEAVTLKIGIQRSRVTIRRMIIPAMCIGLPDLEPGSPDRLPILVQYLTRQMDDFALCLSVPAFDYSQVSILIERFHNRIERPHDLFRRKLALSFPRQRGRDWLRHSKTAEGNCHLQHLTTRHGCLSIFHFDPPPAKAP